MNVENTSWWNAPQKHVYDAIWCSSVLVFAECIPIDAARAELVATLCFVEICDMTVKAIEERWFRTSFDIPQRKNIHSPNCIDNNRAYIVGAWEFSCWPFSAQFCSAHFYDLLRKNRVLFSCYPEKHAGMSFTRSRWPFRTTGLRMPWPYALLHGSIEKDRYDGVFVVCCWFVV